MASEYYGYNRNQGPGYPPDLATVGTSTGSTDIEVRVDLTKGWTSEEIKIVLDAIYQRINDGRYGELANV